MVRQRARIRFRKQGDLRLIGHRDLVRLLERLFRRAGLKLGRSEGFHPKPRMSFPAALALGIEGLEEVMEVELAETSSDQELLRRLQRHAVAGLSFLSIEALPHGTGKARLRSATYRMSVPPERRAEAADRIAALLADPLGRVPRAGRPAPVALRPAVEALWLDDAGLGMRLGVTGRAAAGPRDLLAALGLDDLEKAGAGLVRSQVELAP